jgi:filamentous hemagglutinin
MFQYGAANALLDGGKRIDNTYNVSTRVAGGAQAVLGAVGLAGSVTTAPASCATGVGCVANVVVGTLSADALATGARQVLSGQPETTGANQLLQLTGLSPEAAAYAEMVVGVGAAARAGSVALNATGSARAVVVADDSAAAPRGPVRTGPYEGARVAADETTLLGSERTLPPAPGRLRGEPEIASSQSELRSIARQNEAAETLAQHGSDVEQLPQIKNARSPDLRINGELADVYSPTTSNVQTVRDTLNNKANPARTETFQAPNVVVNLVDSPLSASEVAQYVQRNPVPGLRTLTIIKDGKVVVVTIGG